MRFYVTLLLSLLFSYISAQEKFTLSGTIKDKENGETLIGATVYVEEIKSGTTANVYGFYSITLPKGVYHITYSFVGFSPITKEIVLDKNLKIDLELENTALSLKAVEITAEREDKNVSDAGMSTVNLKMEKVAKIPALLGEVDIIKTIQLLPGINSGGEGSNGFFVRGGSSDQNLILLDGAPVYNASHLLGFFSVFNADAIKDMQVYKGGIPAQFGGRLSSLLDIHMKEGNSKKLSASGGIGTVSSKLTVEGPIKKDKSSFIVSGRRTYADLFLKASKDTSLRKNKLYFYDLSAKVNYQINENNKLFLSGYFGRDVFKFNDEFATSWGNATFTLRWNHLFSQKLFSNITLVLNDYDYNLGVPDGEQAFNWNSKIIDKSIQADFTYYYNPKNTIRFGGGTIYHKFVPSEFTPASDESFFNTLTFPNRFALEHNIYLSDEMDLTGKLKIEGGIRFSMFQNLGVDTIYRFDTSNPEEYTVADTISKSSGIYNTYMNFEPRINIRYLVNEFSSIKASYTRTTQYLHLANNSTSASPLSIWFPSSPNVKPQLADQVAIGFFRNFKSNTYEVSIETYYKKMYNSIDFRDHAQLLFNRYLEGELRIGSAYSYGVELMMKKQKGKFTGWVSYTYSRVKMNIPEINHGKEFFASYDRPHDVSIVNSYDITDRINFSVNWVFFSGRPITVPTGRFQYMGNLVPVYSERNSERMPAYHRLDIGFTFKGKKWDEKPAKKNGKPRWKYESSWNVSVYNVYNRKNAYSITFQQDSNNPNETNAIKTYLFPIIPSITYNFKF
ncbi:MAG: TonB-dependent receptor [Vicingaceae bacterium]